MTDYSTLVFAFICAGACLPSRPGSSGSFSQRIALYVSELIRHACRKRAGSERRKEEKPSGNVLCSLVSVQNAAGCRPLQLFGPGMLALLPAGGTDGEQSSRANELLQSSPSQDLPSRPVWFTFGTTASECDCCIFTYCTSGENKLDSTGRHGAGVDPS